MNSSAYVAELRRALPAQVGVAKVEFTAADYQERIQALRVKMEEAGLSHVLVYADREYFANMEYLIGHDPRFEQALLLIDLSDEPVLFLGNEGMGYSYDVPVPIRRVLYQNFSLQGQPRERLRSLAELLQEAGLHTKANLGIIGFKYFAPEHLEDASRRYDLPSYIIEEIRQVVPAERTRNFTEALIGMPHGLRLRVRKAREIAHYEYIASRCSQKVLRMLQALKPGISEIEISEAAKLDGLPQHVHPMINFGAEHVASGLRSPNDRRLRLGEVAGICLGPRGALVSRVGVASYDEKSMNPELAGSIEVFYVKHWQVLAIWYESLSLGSSCGTIYARLQDALVGLGVYLNPGHYIGADEWVNAPMFQGSAIRLSSGNYLQSDIIASTEQPRRVAIMEDGVILADQALRQELLWQYPDCMARIQERRTFMVEELGIDLADEVLPLSNLCGVYFPFMLDTGTVFTKRA